MKTAALQWRALAADAGAEGLAWSVGAERENQASTVIGQERVNHAASSQGQYHHPNTSAFADGISLCYSPWQLEGLHAAFGIKYSRNPYFNSVLFT